MAHWTIVAPTSLDFDDVTGLRVRLIAGSVAVLAGDEKPSLDERMDANAVSDAPSAELSHKARIPVASSLIMSKEMEGEAR